MTGFAFSTDILKLPGGAFAKAERRWLAHDGIRILALTQGPYRPYCFPLFSPAGYLLSSESPADHPHHNSFWLGSDHVHLLVETAPGKTEEYTYNFYVNEVFQGRAPGRQVETSSHGASMDANRFRIRQVIEWRGPAEWGAENGRVVLHESRQIDVILLDDDHHLRMTSELTAADATVRIGPTRHAFFNARVAETMLVENGGIIRDDRGNHSAEAISSGHARWVDFSGPVGGGARAGMTLIPHPIAGREPTWFVADWGVMTVGAFRSESVDLPPGQALRTGCSLLLHDGDCPQKRIEAIVAGLPAQPLLHSKEPGS